MVQRAKCEMTQKTIISCGHRYFNPAWDKAQNQEIYGDDFSDDGMGHNYEIELTLASSGHDEFEDWSEVFANCIAPSDHRFLNELPEWWQQVPTTENLARYFFVQVEAYLQKHPSFYPVCVRVYEGELLWADYKGLKDLAQVTRVYRMNTLHRHHNPQLSQEDNEKLYNKCSQIHGHEYQIEVSLSGPIHHQSGLVYSRKKWDHLVQEKVLTPLDKSFLNDHLGNTSGEIIVKKIYERLKPNFGTGLRLNLGLRETRNNSFFYS